MDNIEYRANAMIAQNKLRHFGILGMKWGIRRYQNKDGTLTEAGRKRYGVGINRIGLSSKDINEMVKRASDTDNYDLEFLESIQNDDELMKHENKKERLDAYKKFLTENYKFDSQNVIDAKVLEAERNDKYDDDFLDRRGVEFDFNSDDEDAKRQRVKDYRRYLTKNTEDYKIASKEALNKLRDADLLGEEQYDKNWKRTEKAADLGLKALNKIDGGNTYDREEGITDNDREWFVYEDQTIGLPTIADLVIQGKSKEQIKDLIKATKYTEWGDDIKGIYDLGENLWALEKGDIDEYIDACEDIWKKSKQK